MAKPTINGHFQVRKLSGITTGYMVPGVNSCSRHYREAISYALYKHFPTARSLLVVLPGLVYLGIFLGVWDFSLKFLGGSIGCSLDFRVSLAWFFWDFMGRYRTLVQTFGDPISTHDFQWIRSNFGI